MWGSPRFFGALVCLGALFALAGAVPSLLILADLCSALLAVLVVLDLVQGPRARHLAVERADVAHFALRVPAALHYRLRNTSGHPVWVGVLDAPVGQLQFDVDEITGCVPARSDVVLDRAVTPLCRGEAPLGMVYVWVENAIGLVRRRRRLALDQTVRVYPDLSAVQRYGSLRARNRLIEAGLRKMRLRGAGTEFESLREWSGGDPFRSIDWKATARRGNLMVTQHEVERSQNIMLVLDCGRLMTARIDEQRKFDYAITAALSVATIAGLANDKVGFVAFAAEVLFASSPRPSKVALALTSERLYDLEPRFEEADYSTAFRYVGNHLHKRSLVILFTDMVDPVASAGILAEIAILVKRHLVLCVFMSDAAIESALHTPPRVALDVYRAGVAATLSDERRAARAHLTKLGVRVVDAPAAKLSVSLIDAYLDIKARALL